MLIKLQFVGLFYLRQPFYSLQAKSLDKHYMMFSLQLAVGYHLNLSQLFVDLTQHIVCANLSTPANHRTASAPFSSSHVVVQISKVKVAVEREAVNAKYDWRT
jgi:hypothetical protein